MGTRGCHPHQWLPVGCPRLSRQRSGSPLLENVCPLAEAHNVLRKRLPSKCFIMEAFLVPLQKYPPLNCCGGLLGTSGILEVWMGSNFPGMCFAGQRTRWPLTRMWTTCSYSRRMTLCPLRYRAGRSCYCMVPTCISAMRTSLGKAATPTACTSSREPPATNTSLTTGRARRS